MKTFEFSIIASGIDPEADDFGDRFYDAGCDDALVAFQKGHTIIDFAREAETFAEAIASAVENVCAAGATIDRIEPDPLVNLSDIAARTALILETNNLRGGGDLGEALASLKRLIAVLNAQALPPQALAQWIVTHDGFDAPARAEITALAGCPVDFVTIAAHHSYYEAKNLGSAPLRASEGVFPVQHVRGRQANPVADDIAEFCRQACEVHAGENDAVTKDRVYDSNGQKPEKLPHAARKPLTQYCPPSGSQPRTFSSHVSADSLGGTKRQ